MIKYPNGKKTKLNIRPKSKVNTAYRGMNLEEDINLSNKYYLSTNMAVIYKKPTPIQIVKVDYPKRSAAKIVEGYFQTRSTTDYNGVFQGRYIDFEAKETKKESFPFTSIHDHQIEHLKAVVEHGGIGFIIIAFTKYEEVYLIDAQYVVDKYCNATSKHISYSEAQQIGHLIPQGYHPRLDYLQIVQAIYMEVKHGQKEEKEN